ncbi:MAG: DUF3592 domain-containing protein [Deltaproteobacteria bacterium]|nr:DUF3592 domain-containing protein [Deltaproteobacteria bacterium]
MLAVALPLALAVVFERQARRLDDLATNGQETVATVTRLTEYRGQVSTHYAYRVRRRSYDWSVERADAPYAVGETFRVLYSPEAPDLSRPYLDRARAAEEAANNRSFAWKMVAGLAAILALFTFGAHRDVTRLESDDPDAPIDPATYRRRLAWWGTIAAIPMAGITAFHLNEASARGEPLWPVVVATVAAVAILGGVLVFASREGPGAAQAKVGKLSRWLVPIAVGAAVLRLLAALIG